MSITRPAPVADASAASNRGSPTWEVAYLFPLQGEWTEEAYLALDTNRMIELKDGFLEFLPMVTPYHQDLVTFLFRKLDEYVAPRRLGRVYFAPCPVRLKQGHLREPDVFFVNPQRIKSRYEPPDGADLVVEIVSPGHRHRKRDLDEKRSDYAQAGIPEYWIVDPEQQRITVLTLDGDSYRVHGEFQPGQQATSVSLPGFQVDVSAVFAAGQDA